MNLEELKAQISKMSAEEVNKRMSQIANEIDSGDIDALTAETESLNERLAQIKENADKANALRERIANGVAGTIVKTAETDLGSMEYRKAFMNFCQRGVVSPLLKKRAATENVSADLGILLPNTIVQEIIKGVEKVHGMIFNRVKKLSVKGGVQFPIGAFSATMKWSGENGTDTEHGVTDNQKAGGVTGYVQFTYFIGEIRIAQSLLESVLTVEAFEREVINAIISAFLEAMDTAILSGTGVNQPTGILTNVADGIQKIESSHIIEMTSADFADWTKWQSKLFAKVPLSMRKEAPMFHMTAETFEANLMTLKDTTNQPIAKYGYDVNAGAETATFRTRLVEFVEEGAIKSFDSASTGDVVALYWVPQKAYAINTNMQFGYKRYFDENTNQWITKALIIADGKILDPKYIFIIKKKIVA